MGTVRLTGGILAALLALLLTGMGASVWAAESTAEPIALKAATGIDNTVEPLIRGWERFFKISWDSWERSGQAIVGGYIVNQMGSRATRVQLLVEGLDASGRAVDHRVTWLGSELPPWSRPIMRYVHPREA